MDGLLPLTFDECRARLRHRCARAGHEVVGHGLDARGPAGLELTIDVVALGNRRPQRALVVLSGVHGVEGFVGSALQADVVARWEPRSWPADLGVLLVHAVNPWGMAWWRRQNESNVDLNRNWRRSEVAPVHNDAYDELHALACPDTDDLPPIAELLHAAQALVAERGLVWVRDALTVGQYRHADGLHYGGAITEQSNRILEGVVAEHLGSASRVFTVDLHTGHGPAGELTALCDHPPGSPSDAFLQQVFDRVEPTTGNPDATTARKVGQIANGFASLLPGAVCHATSLEIGTVDDLTQLGATYQEQWVHRRGDRRVTAHDDAVWAYRCCFAPDDPQWVAAALANGAAGLDRALAVVAAWR